MWLPPSLFIISEKPQLLFIGLQRQLLTKKQDMIQYLFSQFKRSEPHILHHMLHSIKYTKLGFGVPKLSEPISNPITAS